MREVLAFLVKRSSLGFILFVGAHNPETDVALWALGGLVQGLVSKPDVHAVAAGGQQGWAGPNLLLFYQHRLCLIPPRMLLMGTELRHGSGQDNEPLPAWELLRWAAWNAFFHVSMELFSCRELCLSRQEGKQHPGSAQQLWLPGEEGAELLPCQTCIKGLRTVGLSDFPGL